MRKRGPELQTAGGDCGEPGGEEAQPRAWALLAAGVQFRHTSPAGTRLGQQAGDTVLFELRFLHLPRETTVRRHLNDMLADQEDNLLPLHTSLACHLGGASHHVRPMGTGPLEGQGNPRLVWRVTESGLRVTLLLGRPGQAAFPCLGHSFVSRGGGWKTRLESRMGERSSPECSIRGQEQGWVSLKSSGGQAELQLS